MHANPETANVKRRDLPPLDRKQNGQGDDFAGVQVGLGMFGDIFHLIINLAEQSDDKIFCGYGLPPGCCWSTISLEGPMTFVN
jgi:hypothetical protein